MGQVGKPEPRLNIDIMGFLLIFIDVMTILWFCKTENTNLVLEERKPKVT